MRRALRVLHMLLLMAGCVVRVLHIGGACSHQCAACAWNAGRLRLVIRLRGAAYRMFVPDAALAEQGFACAAGRVRGRV